MDIVKIIGEYFNGHPTETIQIVQGIGKFGELRIMPTYPNSTIIIFEVRDLTNLEYLKKKYEEIK